LARSPRLRRGQALVELALVAPIVLLLGLGMVEIGRLMQVRMQLSQVAREAARAAALSPLPELDRADWIVPDQARALALTAASREGERRANEVAAGFGIAGLEVTFDFSGGVFDRDHLVTATVRHTVHTLGAANLPGRVARVLDVELSASHVEPVDPYESRPGGGRR
jgi:Flp pilus assembly protein TadG